MTSIPVSTPLPHVGRRRGQAEMIGLVLIVVILAIGFLLYIKFSLEGESNAFRQDFETSQLGQSFVTSLVQSEMACGTEPESVEKVVQDIARGTTRCDGLSTTEARLQAHLAAAFTATHELWGRNYNLSLVRSAGGDEELLDPVQLPPLTSPLYEGRVCGQRTPGVTLDHQRIELYPNPGRVELRLYLCP